MKYSVQFPYKVFKLNSISIKSAHSDKNYGYKIKLPDVVFAKSGLGYSDEIEINNLSLVAEVNCSATMYRKCFYSKDPALKILEFKVPKESVNKKFGIDVIIVATNAFGLSEQKIEKGMPLAHLGSFPVKLSESDKGLIEFETTEDKSISYSFGTNTIKIKLPNELYKDLSRMRNRSDIKHLLASQYAQIALLEACKFLTENSGKNHLLWYEELYKLWKEFDKSGKNFPEQDDSHLNLVNYILKEPSLKFTKYLIKQVKSSRDE